MLEVSIIQDDVNDDIDVIEDLYVDLELHVPAIMDVIDLDVTRDKKMNLFFW